jgi:peptide chain release factor 2
VVEQLRAVKARVDGWGGLARRLRELRELIVLAREEGDESFEIEQLGALQSLAEELERFELQTYLSGERDRGDALLTIHPGAGGTESQDWALMPESRTPPSRYAAPTPTVI